MFTAQVHSVILSEAKDLELVSQMPLLVHGLGPQGLKPAFLVVLSGTAEAVPYPKPIYETSSMYLAGASTMHRSFASLRMTALLLEN